MDRVDFHEHVWKYLRANTTGCPKGEDEQIRCRTFFDKLGHLPLTKVKAAIDSYLEGESKFPTYGQLLNLIRSTWREEQAREEQRQFRPSYSFDQAAAVITQGTDEADYTCPEYLALCQTFDVNPELVRAGDWKAALADRQRRQRSGKGRAGQVQILS